MTLLVLFVALAVAVLAAVLLAKIVARQQQRAELVTLRLHFGRGLSAKSVERFGAGLTGLLQPWWQRWRLMPYVVLEVVGTSTGIEHRLSVSAARLQAVEQILQATLPNLRYEAITAAGLAVDEAVEYRLSVGGRPLQIETADLSAKLLAGLQPLAPGEQVVVQWIVTPHPPVGLVRVAAAGGRTGWWSQLWPQPDTVSSAEEATARRRKHSQPLLLAVGRIGAASGDVRRSRQLVHQLEVAWHSSRGPGVQFSRRQLPSRLARLRLAHRLAPLVEWPAVLNSQELAGLVGWPIDVDQLPGLELGGCRPLAPAVAVPRSGTVVGDSTYPGHRRPLALDVEARLRHVHVVGPTGTGKSTLLVNMITSDLAAGRGVVVVDPKGDLVADVLDRIPRHRTGDVVVLDPADTARPVGLNPLRAASSVETEVVVENLVGLFKSLYRSSWGPRTDDILRATLLTLSGTPDATLCEVPLLLTNPTYRRRLVGRLDDPVGLSSFWGWYDGLKEGERLAVVGPVLNKVRAFTMRRTVRAIIGQAEPKLSISRVLAEGRVLLVSLASGLLGEEAASLLGALVVAELWHATKARASLSPAQRQPVMAYLDEWQNLLHLPTAMASVLAEARGLGLGLTLAHQSLGQLPEPTREAVLANARSRVCFQLPSADARIIARGLGGLLSADDLSGLGAYEIVLQAFAAGATQIPATATTRPLPPVSSDGRLLRAQSRARFGTDSTEVDTQIRARQHLSAPPEPLRRKPASGQRGQS